MTDTAIAAWFDRGVQANQAGLHAEAEAAFKAVLAIDPTFDEAQFGLGLTLMAARRFGEAVEPLRQAAQVADTEAVRYICLAQALYMTGEFGRSVEAFEAAERLQPLPANARLTRARASTFAAMIDGPVENALSRYPDLAGDGADEVLTIAQEALSIFGVFDQIPAARSVGRWLLARLPDDPVLAYRLQVLENAPLTRAPAAYVEAQFDAFADRFEHQLTQQLDYRAPALMADLLATQRTQFSDILDLGCGTGLSAPVLARFGGQLTGVDLSAGMLAKAEARGVYHHLERADAVAYLQAHKSDFDLIFAADVMIYFGDLAEVFEAASRALRPGGHFILSTEVATAGWTLLSSGRFAHAPAYVAEIAAPLFDVLEQPQISLRREGLISTPGGLHLLRRKAT
ncbi:MAG: methyltransferase domain-containing protein [Alphaproteobacteria bacterium]|nr:methyltransferase domain-containing protein [Alphaproteobacteria bacterium]